MSVWGGGASMTIHRLRYTLVSRSVHVSVMTMNKSIGHGAEVLVTPLEQPTTLGHLCAGAATFTRIHMYSVLPHGRELTAPARGSILGGS